MTEITTECRYFQILAIFTIHNNHLSTVSHAQFDLKITHFYQKYAIIWPKNNILLAVQEYAIKEYVFITLLVW